MAIFQDYEKKRIELMGKMQTLQEFEKSDEIVGLVFTVSREMLSNEGKNTQNIEWLLKKGNELAQYAGVLDGRANEAWGGYKIAEIAFKSVRDALILASKNEYDTITAARAHAQNATQDAEVDTIAREQKAKNYATVSDICNRVVMFIQTTLRLREQELSKITTSERGGK